MNNELKPLEQFYCDSCGQVIEKIEDGWVEYLTEVRGSMDFGKPEKYRIVHHNGKCQFDDKSRRDVMLGDFELRSWIGYDGINEMVALLENNYVKNNDEIVQMIRRLHVPYFEEARRYFDQARQDGLFDGISDHRKYDQSLLKEIMENYT